MSDDREQAEATKPWQGNIEALAVAIIMALLLKYFIIEAYKIPSGSMQPTLIGDKNTQVFDRILVDKLSFRIRAPKRFEVVVFKYPLDLSKNFVKRIIGIGPEELRILDGDLWHRPDDSEPWRILRRTRGVQGETWKRLDRLEHEISSWFPDPTGLNWAVEGRSIEARGPGLARFGMGRGSIMDGFLDGYPDSLIEFVKKKPGTGVHPVGDLRVDGRVIVGEETVSVGVELHEGTRKYRFRIPGPAAPAGARVSIHQTSTSRFGDTTSSSTDESEVEFRLEAGKRYEFGAQNLDDLLELEVNGEVLLSIEVPNATDQRSACMVFQEGGPTATATFSGLMAYRDIYYTGGNHTEYQIPADHYFMLGDNTQDSSDSREWKVVRLEAGPSSRHSQEAVLMGESRGGDDPWQRNPWQPRYSLDDSSRVRFRDVYGEVWWFDGPGVPYADPPTRSEPYVPRRLVSGRALAVFWPLAPWKDLYRLKWIH